jgi:hypothetical protein
VNDEVDQCPDTPAQTPVDALGCPVDVNVAPEVSLSATQNAVAVTSLSKTGGPVVISALVTDSNDQDTHTFVWSVTGVTNFSTNEQQISFNPSELSVSEISIEVQVSDSASPSLSSTTSLSLNLSQPTPIEPETPDSGGGTLSVTMLLGLILLAFRRKYSQ